MANLKIRLEAELTKGDLVTAADAVADALEAAAEQMRANPTTAQAIINVPRGKLVFLIDTPRAKAQEPDDGI